VIRPPTLAMPQITPQRDPRALPASSTAVAGSAFYDARDTSSDGAGVRGNDTGWQMAHTTDYRVRAADITAIFTDSPARFRYSKERSIERGKSMLSPRVFAAILKTSVTMLGTPAMMPGTY
jgi:hypothetical protein